MNIYAFSILSWSGQCFVTANSLYDASFLAELFAEEHAGGGYQVYGVRLATSEELLKVSEQKENVFIT